MDLELFTDIKWWSSSSDVCTSRAINMTVVRLCWRCTGQPPTADCKNGLWLLGPSPLVFLFSPAWKQNKAEAGGTQNGIGTLHIVPRASSSTFLGWLGSGPPVLEYCSNSTAPQTWPQPNHSCLHWPLWCSGWVMAIFASSVIPLSFSLTHLVTLTRICCLSLSASMHRPQSCAIRTYFFSPNQLGIKMRSVSHTSSLCDLVYIMIVDDTSQERALIQRSAPLGLPAVIKYLSLSMQQCCRNAWIFKRLNETLKATESSCSRPK